MIRFVAAALLAAFAGAPSAAADPQILVPACTGGQVPEVGECVAVNPFDGQFGDAPGANPNVLAGLTPQNQPMLAPLGVTPQDFPVVFPLGVTPPNIPLR